MIQAKIAKLKVLCEKFRSSKIKLNNLPPKLLLELKEIIRYANML